MSTVVERIRELMDKKNIKQKDLVNYLQVNQGTIAKWLSQKEKHRRDIPNTILVKIAKYLGVTVEYLIDGSPQTVAIRHLPIIGSASCGVPTNHYYDELGELERYPIPADLYGEDRYFVKAIGDSMLPKIKENDLILCDPHMRVENGNIVHYTLNNEESGIKKAVYDEDGDLVMLIPLNSDYPPITLKKIDTVIMARCLKIVSDL